MAEPIRSHRELKVYQGAFQCQGRVFELSNNFPKYEQYSLTDQMRRSSRGVCRAIGEAWRKRRYPPHWTSKLTDAESEAAETQISLEAALQCGYITRSEFDALFNEYEIVLGQLVLMATKPHQWGTPHPRIPRIEEQKTSR
ncbi:MAG TPA: four helix bundle protein [Longimicrobiales bacterium]